MLVPSYWCARVDCVGFGSQLWRRFHSALAWVLDEAESGDLFDGVDSAVVAECLDEFKGFYSSRCVVVAGGGGRYVQESDYY